MDKRCSWNVKIFLCQNRSTISGSVPQCRQLILWQFLGFLSIYYHRYRQKVKTNVVYQTQVFHQPYKNGDLYFSQQQKLFRYDCFRQNNLTKSTYTFPSFLFKLFYHKYSLKTQNILSSSAATQISRLLHKGSILFCKTYPLPVNNFTAFKSYKNICDGYFIVVVLCQSFVQ